MTADRFDLHLYFLFLIVARVPVLTFGSSFAPAFAAPLADPFDAPLALALGTALGTGLPPDLGRGLALAFGPTFSSNLDSIFWTCPKSLLNNCRVAPTPWLEGWFVDSRRGLWYGSDYRLFIFRLLLPVTLIRCIQFKLVEVN